MEQTSSSGETFDIIFAGGGATACVTAGRLAQADPALKILILEAGPLTRDVQEHIQPGRCVANILTPIDKFDFHIPSPSASLAGRTLFTPTGKCLGGGSSVNFMMYTRAAASDYDEWENEHHNPGWGSKQLIPLLKKVSSALKVTRTLEMRRCMAPPGRSKPQFQARWKSYFEKAPDKGVMLLMAFAGYLGRDAPASPHEKLFSAMYLTTYPVSIGHVHITAGLDPYGKSDFKTGCLEDPADLGTLRWVYKRGRELARRMTFYRGERKTGHPDYPQGSEATCDKHTGPVDIDSPDIVYTAEDDKAIYEYHRKFTQSAGHSIGTCAMKPREKGGVVDPSLNVYGVENLKVADCSITPSNVGANTYNTALAIGEKAAVIIAQDLGIAGVSEA